MTCVPVEGLAIASFLRFFFLTREGLRLLEAASPGGAGRNRTLGVDALERLEVPVPPIEDQLRFEILEAQFKYLGDLQSEASTKLDALLPSILERTFREES
jgi:type I restriction enzyme S subunit